MKDYLYNGDCIEFMTNHMECDSVDVILTSPPYNTARSNMDYFNDTKKGRYTKRYVDLNDMKTDEEYFRWTFNVFELFDKVLKPNGVVLYNINYATRTHESFLNLISDIQRSTNFGVADIIAWKKKSALPNTASPNKLTRIWEPVFVFCRHDEYKTYTTNKKVVSESKGTGQKNYENMFNFIEAKNNDGSCVIHKATYSTELCEELLMKYVPKGSVVFDPFIGTGTTAIAAMNLGHNYIGCEIYKDYYDLALKRIEENKKGRI